jgi:homocysteine S-methyltransferase
MARYPDGLPQTRGQDCITDGGLETSLVFIDKVELPCFAAFPLVDSVAGRKHLADYFRPFLELAAQRGAGFVIDTPTWRANPDWGEKLGYDAEALSEANRRSVAFTRELADMVPAAAPVIVNGILGPRGDGYRAEAQMAPDEAQAYHTPQIAAFAEAGVDMAAGVTMTYAEEAIGIARAAAEADVPCAVSFTVETDGRLPSGQTLKHAIEQVDAATGGSVAYYMINCAHPTHFEDALAEHGAWRERIMGVRANASRMSHAELDEAPELDRGDPADLGRRYVELRRRLPNLTVLGGCCGTDLEHVTAICDAVLPVPA